jgi:hypothetical protein
MNCGADVTGPLGAGPIVRPVLAALAVVIPLGLAGAVSPVMLMEQIMLLAVPDGGRDDRVASGSRPALAVFAFGTVATPINFGFPDV